jgi:hypothetical protein
MRAGSGGSDNGEAYEAPCAHTPLNMSFRITTERMALIQKSRV